MDLRPTLLTITYRSRRTVRNVVLYLSLVYFTVRSISRFKRYIFLFSPRLSAYEIRRPRELSSSVKKRNFFFHESANTVKNE